MPKPIDSSKLKQIHIEKRSYPLLIVGLLLFVWGAFLVRHLVGHWLAVMAWIVLIAGIVEYFRGFR